MNDEGEFPLGCQLWLEGLVMLQMATPAHILLYTTCTIGPAPLFAGGAFIFGIFLRNFLELAGAGIVGASEVWLGL